MKSLEGVKSGRRWLQFSLRGLLVFMVFVAFGLGWIGNERRKVRSEDQAVEEIERLGGMVERCECRYPVSCSEDGRLARWQERLFGKNVGAR